MKSILHWWNLKTHNSISKIQQNKTLVVPTYSFSGNKKYVFLLRVNYSFLFCNRTNYTRLCKKIIIIKSLIKYGRVLFKFVRRVSLSNEFLFVPGEIRVLKIETNEYADFTTWMENRYTFAVVNCEERSCLWTVK